MSMFFVSAAVAQTDVVKHIYCYVCDSTTNENCGDGESIDSFQQLNCTEDIGDTCFKRREGENGT